MITSEALECLGGNGYVEESIMPRLLRDAPLNSIWEGSGNVTSLDVLRALSRAPDSADALLAEIDQAAAEPLVAAAASRLRTALKEAAGAGIGAQRDARLLAGQIAVTLQAALLARHAPRPVADAYLGSRLGPGQTAGPGAPFGSLPGGLELAAILERSSAVAVSE